MGRPGVRSVSLRDQTYRRLSKVAGDIRRTVPKLIEHMLETLYPKQEAEP